MYLEYHRVFIKYKKSLNKLEQLLAEQEQLFELTQPKGVNTEKEQIIKAGNKNPFDDYLIQAERKKLGAKIETQKYICAEQKALLDAYYDELRASKDWLDLIYSLSYIDKLTVAQIERKIPYERRQIYRILKKIKNEIEVIL